VRGPPRGLRTTSAEAHEISPPEAPARPEAQVGPPPPVRYSTPGTRCNLPSKSFGQEQDALDYAREAAATFRHPYAVWWIWQGRVRLVRRFEPPATKPA
jgi:hypothetical protein